MFQTIDYMKMKWAVSDWGYSYHTGPSSFCIVPHVQGSVLVGHLLSDRIGSSITYNSNIETVRKESYHLRLIPFL